MNFYVLSTSSLMLILLILLKHRYPSLFTIPNHLLPITTPIHTTPTILNNTRHRARARAPRVTTPMATSTGRPFSDPEESWRLGGLCWAIIAAINLETLYPAFEHLLRVLTSDQNYPPDLEAHRAGAAVPATINDPVNDEINNQISTNNINTLSSPAPVYMPAHRGSGPCP